MKAIFVYESLQDVLKPKSEEDIKQGIRDIHYKNDKLEAAVEYEMLDVAIEAIKEDAEITDEALSLFNRADVNLANIYPPAHTFYNLYFKDGKIYFEDWIEFLDSTYTFSKTFKSDLSDYLSGDYSFTYYHDINDWTDFLIDKFPEINITNLTRIQKYTIESGIGNMVDIATADEVVEHYKKEVINQLGLKNIEWDEKEESFKADISRQGSVKIVEEGELGGDGILFNFKQEYFPDYDKPEYIDIIKEKIKEDDIQF